MVFGLGGLLITLVAYPLLLLLTNKTNRYQYGQLIIHGCFRFFIGMMRMLGLFTIEIKNQHRLKNCGLYLVANHPTLIDVAIILALVKQSDCVVNSKLTHNVFTKWPLLAAGYISNDNPEQLVESCVDALKAGRNLVVFPEGTRTKNLHKLKFKRGAALIAVKSGHNMLPITIKCTPRMLAKGQKWYKIPAAKPHFTITVGEALTFSDNLDSQMAISVQSRKVNRLLLNYYIEELKIGKINR